MISILALAISVFLCLPVQATSIQDKTSGTWEDSFVQSSSTPEQTNVTYDSANHRFSLVNTPTTNLLINSSFAITSVTFPYANSWGRADGFGLNFSQEGVVTGQNTALYSGGRAYRFTIQSATAPGGYAYIAQGLQLKPNTTYTISMTGANFAPNLSSFGAFMQNTSPTNMWEGYGSMVWAYGEEGRKSVTFTTPSYMQTARFGISLNQGSDIDNVSGYVQVGSVQVEESGFASRYSDGSLGTGYSFNSVVSPAAPTLTSSATGGSLVAGTYYYAVTALNSNGQTVASPMTSVVLTGTTSSVVVKHIPSSGATAYRVYRGTTPTNLGLIFTGSVSQGTALFYTPFTDTGIAAGVAPPSSSTATAVAHLSTSTRSLAAAYYHPATTGTLRSEVITPTTLKVWKTISWGADLNEGSVKIQLLDKNGALIPESSLPGNASGFTSSPLSIATLSVADYPSLMLKATLATTDSTKTPYINDWSASWNPDTTVPIGSVAISALTQENATIKLTLTATDAFPEDSSLEMLLSNQSTFSEATWEPFVSEKTWKLADNRVVYAKFRDASGNESPLYSTGGIGKVALLSFGTVNFNSKITKWYYTGHRPAFKGTAQPQAQVMVIIHSDPVYCSTVADANGAWSCTPPVDIVDGEHTVVIQTIDSSGRFASMSFSLGINTGLAATGEDPQNIRVMSGVLITICGVALLLRKRLYAY